MDYRELDLKRELVFLLLKAMVAYDELGSLLPVKRTLQVIDYQNQANKESEVSIQRTRLGNTRSRLPFLSLLSPCEWITG